MSGRGSCVYEVRCPELLRNRITEMALADRCAIAVGSGGNLVGRGPEVRHRCRHGRGIARCEPDSGGFRWSSWVRLSRGETWKHESIRVHVDTVGAVIRVGKTCCRLVQSSVRGRSPRHDHARAQGPVTRGVVALYVAGSDDVGVSACPRVDGAAWAIRSCVEWSFGITGDAGPYKQSWRAPMDGRRSWCVAAWGGPWIGMSLRVVTDRVPRVLFTAVYVIVGWCASSVRGAVPKWGGVGFGLMTAAASLHRRRHRLCDEAPNRGEVLDSRDLPLFTITRGCHLAAIAFYSCADVMRMPGGVQLSSIAAVDPLVHGRQCQEPPDRDRG